MNFCLLHIPEPSMNFCLLHELQLTMNVVLLLLQKLLEHQGIRLQVRSPLDMCPVQIRNAGINAGKHYDLGNAFEVPVVSCNSEKTVVAR